MPSVVSTNPSTGEQRSLDVAETTPVEVAEATSRAASAASEFAARPLSWRAGMLRGMADALDADTETIVALADEETALGIPRLRGELRRTTFQLRFFADVVEDGLFLDVSIDHAKDSPMGLLPDLRRMRVPLGPVGVFGSSNFPLAFSVPGGDTASALAAGCTVVIKAHPAHPATSMAAFAALTRAADASGAPGGTLGLLHGFEAGIALVDAAEIAAVGFTGSVSAGRILLKQANSRPTPIPFYGELGAANPLVVTPAAAAERPAEIAVGAAQSMTLGAGQFCTKPGLLFVPTGVDGDSLVDALVEAVSALGSFTMLTSGIADHFRTTVSAIEAVRGVRPLVRGSTAGPGRVTAALYEVRANRFGQSGVTPLREECFGPLALVIRYGSADELASALEAAEPALTLSVFVAANDPDAAWLLRTSMHRAGRVTMNSYPTGVSVSWSMQHGGPWPSTTAPGATSVGARAIERWLRPVALQSVPNAFLPDELKDANPLGIPRRIDGVLQTSQGKREEHERVKPRAGMVVSHDLPSRSDVLSPDNQCSGIRPTL